MKNTPEFCSFSSAQFDSILKEKNYPSRSEAIRDAVSRYIQNYEWMVEIEGQRSGTIIVLYDGVKRGLIGSIWNS